MKDGMYGEFGRGLFGVVQVSAKGAKWVRQSTIEYF